MTYFLERIATHLLAGYGDRLEKQCLVFPNRRAGLYFMKYLAVKAGKPVWAPSVKTINELFTSFSVLQEAGPETLIFELYRSYCRLNPKAGSFDDFYFWGEMLLNDFDNVDKYMVNAESLFTNLADLKKIDSAFGELQEDQVNIIRQFWVNFNTGGSTREKTDFLGLWSILFDLYSDFRNALRKQGIAYEGMIFRDMAENFKRRQLPEFRFENFHFAGFNALNSCEKILMSSLREKRMAKFYWDYDESTVLDNPKHSAGFFLKDNLRDFGNDMPADWNYRTFVSDPAGKVKRTIIDASSDISQVKLLPSLLGEIEEARGADAHHTAVILAEESLLIPLLTTIPEFVSDVNITMGYPLKFSPVYSLLSHLLSLQRNARKVGDNWLFDHSDVMNILRHNYFSAGKTVDTGDLLTEMINENKQWISHRKFIGKQYFENIFTPVSSPQALHEYLRNVLETLSGTNIDEEESDGGSDMEDKIRNEFIFRALLAMNRLESALAGSEINLSTITYSRLLDKILRAVSIPFSGEPLNGIQIMGILETRALDFKNLIILSVNEGILPRSSAGTSYIPHNLREAFGLPVIRHQDSIYAYYFYRLLQRAENVTFVYNSNAEGLKTGEMSRFLLQLDYLNVDTPEYRSIGYDIITRGSVPSVMKRTEHHSEILEEMFLKKGNKTLSPSAVNTWLNCRMRFYYRYVCGLKEPDRIITEIDPAVFGKLLHGVMEEIYLPFVGNILGVEKIGELRKDVSLLKNCVNEVIKKIYHSGEVHEQGGNDEIIANILFSYARMILDLDRNFAPLTITGLEKYISSPFLIRPGSNDIEITIGGYTDRMDITTGTSRVIDYKTGNIPMEIRSVESLFDETDDKRNDSWFQILMYCEMLLTIDGTQKVRPSLYAVRNMTENDFSDKLILAIDRDNKIIIDNYADIRSEYSAGLKQTIEDIFRKDSQFSMTEHERKCGYCPYKKLCQR
jgi:CRISPR/Cas system-associated exonuclease Cas4 (RecB family)